MDNNKKQTVSTPVAIIIAGFLIMLGIIFSKSGPKNINTNNTSNTSQKTLSEQVGISKSQLDNCMQNTDAQALNAKIQDSVNKAMSNIPQNQRGTPFSVILGPNNVNTYLGGAAPLTTVQDSINQVKSGKVKIPYTGNVPPTTSADHIYGNQNAPITIIEYSDFECPYCKTFHPILKQTVDQSNGGVKWVYRSFPIHQDSFKELLAAECVAKIKGNDAFWKYGDLLFGIQSSVESNPTTANKEL